MSESELVSDFVKKEQELFDAMGIADLTTTNEILSGEKEMKDEIKEEAKETTNEDDKVVDKGETNQELENTTPVSNEAFGKDEDLTSLSNFISSTVTTPPLHEPEELLKWKAERAERLQKKDAEEATKVAELRQLATIELKKWYADRDIAIEVTKAENRQREIEHENLLNKKEQFTTPDWENIFKMCLLHSPKHGKERMRKLLTDIKDHTSE